MSTLRADSGYGIASRPQGPPYPFAGEWPCSACGGVATVPEHYEVTSLVTGERIKLVSDEIRVSAITLAELLRLGQAARAVRDGRPGAVDKLDLVLSEAPEPISRYRPRAPKGFSEWATLATLILMLVQTLVPILKQDGSVSEQELINIIERLVDQSEAGKLKDSAEDSARAQWREGCQCGARRGR